MLSDFKISMIQQNKGTTTFSIQFIKDFDREWDDTVRKLKKCNFDLSRIPITYVTKEYMKRRKKD